MNKIINTNCINNDKPFEAFKVNELSGNRKELVFLHNRRLEVGAVVAVKAMMYKIYQPLAREVTGNKERKDGLWENYVIVQGA